MGSRIKEKTLDKRTITGFAIIFASIFFFQSDFYYNKLLGRPSPRQVLEKNQKKAIEQKKETQQVAKTKENSTSISSAPTQTDSDKKSALAKAKTSATPLDTVTIETPLYVCKIDLRGAKIISWKIKGYMPFGVTDTNVYAEIIPENSLGATNLTFNNINCDTLEFNFLGTNTYKKNYKINKEDSLTLKFICTLPTGGKIEKDFLLRGNNWLTDLTVKKYNVGPGKLGIGILGGINSVDKDPNKKPGKRSGPGGYNGFLLWGESVEKVNDFENNVSEYTGLMRWACIREGYFGSAIILDSQRDATVDFERDMNGKILKNMSFVIKEDFENESLKYSFFSGPMKHSLAKSFDVGLEGTIFQGYSWFFRADIWFPSLCGFILWLLNYFYSLTHDYGIAIIFLTIISRVITIPLTLKSQKSMSAMKDLQPKIAAVKAQHKADPTKMNSELMKLYKKHGVSPMGGGCLPMFLQMPIFISLFVSLRKAIELRGAGTFLPWISDLSKPDFIFDLGFSIPMYGSHVGVLPIVMAVATFFQNKMTIKDPNQKMMVYLMPIFFLFMFNSFPAGLNLYWTLSTLIGILQQVIVESRKKTKKQVIVR